MSEQLPAPMRIISDMFRRFTDFWWSDRGLSIFLLLLFISLFLRPFVDWRVLKALSSLFFTLLLISGCASITSRPVPRIAVAVAAVAAITLSWANNIIDNHAITVWSTVTALLFLVLLNGVMLVRIFRDNSKVTASRVLGAVSVYILFGLTWSNIYVLFDLMVTGSFNIPVGHLLNPATRQENFIYFSFITLTTLGYGDIIAVHPTVRLFVIMEALVGQLYPATLLARLVSLEVSHTNRDRADVP